ncbi:MBL fold metallo-hydrolase [bacterium]|nr:MAG: MBL fold metallo-hydrolase [bacterium]
MRLFIWIFLATLSFSFTADESEPSMTKRHHKKDGFKNNYPIDDHGFSSIIKWQFSTMGKKGKVLSFPVEKNNPEWIRNNTSEPVVTWINHSTFLIQIDGVNILTDPIFSDRCSPVQWAGPKRTTPVGLALDSLPKIDFVIISHDHYDHLDTGSIEQIESIQKDNPPVWFVPLKVKERLVDWGVKNVVEMDWWDSDSHSGFEIHCVPAQHFSGRSLSDRNSTLWAGWVLIKDNKRFFFAGDTGYSPDFKEIGKRLGPFDVSFIPIGAYNPRWFMRGVHVDPYEAIKIHKDVQSKFSIGMHWGTFSLADEDMDEPPRALKDGLQKEGIDESRFVVMKNGQMMHLKSYLSEPSLDLGN